MDYTINFERMRKLLDNVSQFGLREDESLWRMAFTEADWQSRQWLLEEGRKAGFDSRIDPAGNVILRYESDANASRPAVMVGSHLDSVPNGGTLDGALGVISGLEALLRLKELGVELQRPLELVAFSDEEGRFGPPLGSRAMVGDLSPADINRASDLDGVSLHAAMAEHGLDARKAIHARRPFQSLDYYLELHIEQGPVLDTKHISCGIVEGITGLIKWRGQLLGEADHAGTTPIPMRRDAFLGLAEFAGEIPRLLEEHGSEHSVATIGRVELTPGIANTVSAVADFSLDIRDPDNETLHELADACRRAISAIARRRKLMFEFQVLSEIAPVACDSSVVEQIVEAARGSKIEYLGMVSGAAHDAQVMASITKVGMIFVSSRGGKSHSPAEWTPHTDMERGANLLLNALYRLANREL